jgi:hypothetical protein
MSETASTQATGAARTLRTQAYSYAQRYGEHVAAARVIAAGGNPWRQGNRLMPGEPGDIEARRQLGAELPGTGELATEPEAYRKLRRRGRLT